MTDDRKLRETIKSYMKEAPENSFFTRKVLNRLPERKWNKEDRFMLAIYTVSILITIVSWFIFACRTGILEGQLNVTGSDNLYFASFLVILAAEIWLFVRIFAKE